MVKRINWVLVGIFAAALVLRLLVVFVAHHGDLNNNISWGTLALQRGLNGFYESGNWSYSNPNQPPLTILTFAGTKLIWQGVENVSWFLNRKVGIFPSTFVWFWEAKGMDLIVKLPGIFADLVIAWLIYKYTSRLLLSVVWLFNPIVWYNSAVWGQTDSIVNLLGFVGILFLIKKDLIKSFFFLTLSALFKGSLALFMPIVFAYAIFQKHSLKNWLFAFGYSLLAVIVVSFWFHPKWDLLIWLFNLYKNRIFPGEIGYLTANAFNFWWLVNPGKILDSAVYFGLPARIWGIIAAVSGLIASAFWLKKKLSANRLFLVLCFMSLVSFLFMTRVHERYLYPFFLPATILLGSIPGMIVPYVVLSITYLFNLYHLFWAPGIPVLINLYSFSWFPVVLSIINLAVFVYLFILSLLKGFDF